MAETTREMVVRLTMDAGGFKKTADEIKRQIKNIDSEINSMGAADNKKSKLEEKLELQKSAVNNLKSAVEQARTAFNNASDGADKLAKARSLANLESQLESAELKAAALARQLSSMNYLKYGKMVTNFGSAMQRMGRQFSMYIGAPLAALGISSFNAFKEYEMSLTRLKAVLPEAGEEIEKLNQSALEMSETIPVSYEELMAIMTGLAKAGVPVQNIEKMTLTLARMAAVTGMTADEVSTGMVMFMNAMHLPMNNIDQLGAALVQVADASIASEEQIFNMSTNMAAVAGLAGFSATDVLALSAAFASMGVEAEAGGTATSKLINKMTLAAETGGETLDKFSGIMGISAEQFTRGWKNAPVDTMLAFFNSLSKVDASGESSVSAVLADMGLTEIRMNKLISLGASNPDMFEMLMGTSTSAFKDNTALVEKAGTIFDTVSGEMTMLANATRNAQADMGENVADTFQPLIDKVGELVKGFGELDEDTQTRWVKIGAALVLLGPAAAGVGSFAKGIGTLMTHIGKVKAGDAVGFFGALKNFISTPFGTFALATAGVAGLFAVFDSIQSPTEKIVNDLRNIKISYDEESYQRTIDGLNTIKAYSDALSGEVGEHYANVSSAVKAGYGTDNQYGKAIGYEATLTEKNIADIAGKYADRIDKLYGEIGAETDKARQDALYKQASDLQKQWDDEVKAAKDNYMSQVSALVAGMMESQPEAKAALEKASKDYDLLAKFEEVMSTGVFDQLNTETTKSALLGIFSEDQLKNILSVDNINWEHLTAGYIQIEEKLAASLMDAANKMGGENSLAYQLWQTILSDPLTSSLFDETKTTGVLDGIVELFDFKSAGEKAGENFGNALSPGLNDAIIDSIPGTDGAMLQLQNHLVSQAAAMGKAVAAAFNSNLNFTVPNVNVNSPTGGTGIYNIRRELNAANNRTRRGYGG